MINVAITPLLGFYNPIVTHLFSAILLFTVFCGVSDVWAACHMLKSKRNVEVGSPMVDSAGWIALFLAWVASFFSEPPREPWVHHCNCNCTCEVEAVVCGNQTSWWFEGLKVIALIVSGFLTGTGFLLSCVKTGLGYLISWIIWLTQQGEGQVSLGAPTTRADPTSRTSSLAISEEVAGQQERARQQLETLKQRRALKN